MDDGIEAKRQFFLLSSRNTLFPSDDYPFMYGQINWIKY